MGNFRLQAAVARGLTKFVGRETEIAALTRALEQAQAGHGQIVAVVGQAGVGKSRLVYEFVHSHRTQGWLVLESASVSYGKATPYFPVIDLLKRYTHLDEHDDTRTIRAKVTGQILTLNETLQETIPALLSLLDALPQESPFLQLDPPQRRLRTLDALKRILVRESQVQPLLLVFEDLHWIDAETQALLDRLVESLPTVQVFLLVNYRPEYHHGWGNKNYYTQLRLDPLLLESAEDFLQALLGDDPGLEPVKQLLIARTEGNPFFLEESVRTLVETRVLIGEPGAYRLVPELPTVQMPATVQAVLAARIDRLPADEKRLLQTAAVIGTEIPWSLLQTVADFPEETLHRGLTHLQATEFLYEMRLFPEPVYTFKHALTHEVAYGSLLQERRRMLHARIVEALEGLYTDRLDEQIERLAHHALRGEVWDKTLLYCRQAGAKATGRSAYREAVVGFEQALGALEHLPACRDMHEQGIDLRLDLQPALVTIREDQRRSAYLQEAETLAKLLDDQPRLGRVYSAMIQHFMLMGDHDRALDCGQHALTLTTASGEVGYQAFTHGYLGVVHYKLGNYHQAMDCFRQALACLEGGPSHAYGVRMIPPAMLAHIHLALCYEELGAFAEGVARGEEAARIAEAAEHMTSTIFTQFALGHIALRQGDLPQAISRLEGALAGCRAADIPILMPVILSRLGLAYALCGRATEVLSCLDQAVEEHVSGKESYYIPSIILLSETYQLSGRPEDAVRFAEYVLVYSRDRKERGHQAHALRLLGEVAMRHDPPDAAQAESHYQQALALANELGMRPLQAHCHRGLGTLYSQTGRPQQAHTELTTAIELYRAMEMTFWLPQAEAALAEVERR